MYIKLTRPDRFYAALTRLKVRLDGELVCKIKNGGSQTIELDPQQETATIQIKQWFARSNKLDVRAGDAVVIDTRKWIYFLPMAVGLIGGVSPIAYSRLFSEVSWLSESIFIMPILTGALTGIMVSVPFSLFESYQLRKV